MTSKLFAFSGAGHSGKSTAINRLKGLLQADGHHYQVLHELMRNQRGISDIDEIRRDSSKYLAVQSKIIREKIKQEAEAAKSGVTTLVDRSIADSLYYLTSYTTKHKLNPTELDEYAALVRLIHDHAASGPYAAVFVFRPLAITQVDSFRPANLVKLQRAEFSCIRTLNRGLFEGQENVHFRTVTASSHSDMEAVYAAIIKRIVCH